MRTTSRLSFGIIVLAVLAPCTWAAIEGPSAPDPNRHLEIGPINSLTTRWHIAPSEVTLPSDQTLLLRVQVADDVEVSWQGVTTVTNTGSWSVAECQVSHLAEQTITVTATAPNGFVAEDSFEESIVVSVNPFPVEKIRFSPVDVWSDAMEINPDDVNASTYYYFRGHSIAELQDLGRGLYQTSINRMVNFAVDVEPAAFANLIEWQTSDGIAHLGTPFTISFHAKGRHIVSMGPERHRQEVMIETYDVEIVDFDASVQIPESEGITFTAVTDPPGFEHNITWLASTTFGATSPIVGKGEHFNVRFDDTFGNNGFRWVGVKADNSFLGQDTDGVNVTGCSPNTGGQGTTVSVNGGGFGNDPDDLCLVLQPGGEVAARAFAANGTSVQAEVGAVPAGASPGEWLVVRGNGSRAAIPDSAEILGIPDAWAFEGSDGPAAEDTCADTFTPIENLENLGPGVPVPRFQFVPCGNCQPSCVITEGQLRATVPADACPNPPPNGYPTGTALTIDVHFDVRCASSCQRRHFDCFAPTLVTQTPLTSAQVAADLANKIDACFVNNGITGISFLAFGNDIQVSMPGCEIYAGGGSIFINAPGC